jgi:ABC-type cobalamin/Fe3+-siderophores transport system ATPase subunit
MIDLVNITLHYSVKPVLRNLSLRVESGELVGVTGANGTGKSTLLQVASGVLSPLEDVRYDFGMRMNSQFVSFR